MKIENLSLVNFGNHANSSLALSHINFIQGQNNSGKTLVLDSIRWLLQGYCRNMKNSSDRTGELDLVRLNSNDKMYVAMTFVNNGAGQVRLTKGRTKTSTSIQLQSVEKKEPVKQEDIFKLLRCDEKQITAVLDGMKGFLELDSKERKQLLFNLLGVNLNVQLIKEHLSQHDITEPFLSKVAEVVIHEGFKSAMDKAVEKRKEFKRLLADLNIAEPVDKKVLFQDKDIDLSSLEVDQVQQVVEQLKSERESLLKQVGKLEQMQEVDVIKLDQRKMLLIPEIETAQAELDELNKQQSGDIENKKKVFKDSIADHESNIKKRSESIIKLKYELDQLTRQIDEIEKLGDKCPKCQSQLTDEVKKKIITSLKNDSKSKQVEYDTAVKLEKDVRENLKKVIDDLAELNSFYDQQKTLKEKLDKLKAEQSELNEQIKKTKTRTSSKDDLPKLHEELEGNKHISDEMEILLNEVKTYRQTAVTFKNNSDKKEKYDAAIKIYDKLAKLLAPDGIVNDILKSVIGKFQKRIDAVNNILTEIYIDKNELTFNFGHKTEAMLDKRGSEWQRLAWLVSEAIAHFSGLKIWLVDRVDILDGDNKNSLMKLIKNIQDDYETIIVTGTRDQQPDVSANNGMRFFWVDNGIVK